MRIIRQASEFGAGQRAVCVAIGVFDGVHLGHQQVIRQALSDAGQHEAASVIITFDRHPNSVVAPGRNPPLIYPLETKLKVLESFGPTAVLLIRFDDAFSKQGGDEFIRHLARDFGRIYSICVGGSFTFGHKRSGDVNLLRKLGQELGFVVHGLSAVSLDGKVVSSTRIREAIRQGDLDAASQMLGRPYSLSGTVRQGNKLGRTLGFPTANLDVTGLVVPPTGVYAVHAVLDNRTVQAVLNIGYRPTVAAQANVLQVEAHLLDFDADLYDQSIEIVFCEKLREETRFESLDALKAQIQRDIKLAREKFC